MATPGNPETGISHKLGWLVALPVLAFVVWHTTSGLESVMDIRFYDESYYLTQGFFQPIRSWIADYSPFYSLYYKGLSCFFSDPIQAYYLNYSVWSMVIGLMVFCVLRWAGVAWPFALVWAVFSSSAQINLPLWPKAGHLAMVGVGVGLWGWLRWRARPLVSLIWICGCTFALSWCRPEFSVGGFLALAMAAFCFIREKQKGIQIGIPLVVFIPGLLVLCFAIFWGFPFGQSGRGAVAFGQHFVHNWRNITGQASGDFMEEWVNWRETFARVFGSGVGFPGILLNNPFALLKHLGYNVIYLIYNTYLYFFETLFPVRWLGISVSAGLAVLWFLAEYFHGFSVLSGLFPRIRNFLIRQGVPLFPLAVPSLLAGFAFQPRPHYILPLFPLFLWGIGRMVSCYRFADWSAFRKRILVFGILAFQLILLPDVHWFFALRKTGESAVTSPDRKEPFGWVTSAGFRHRDLVIVLRKENWPDSSRIFDASTGATEYLGSRLKQCGKRGFEMDYPLLSDFHSFLEQENVNAVFLHSTYHFDHFFRDNAGFQSLKARPADFGWIKKPVGIWGDSLLWKRHSGK